MKAVLLPGDCLEQMASLPVESVDSCVTDPPYHFASIVKRFGAANAAPVKVGATGAYERASRGFMGKEWDGGDIAFRPETWAAVLRVLKPGAHVLAFGSSKGYHRMACAIEDAGFEIRDTIMWLYGTGFPKSHNLDGEWQGWGTTLKPAFEPVIMARKPLIGTVEKNVLTHCTGAINIDGCRVPFLDEADEAESKAKNQHAAFGSGPMTNAVYGRFGQAREDYNPPGRFPANVLHDGAIDIAEGRFFYSAKATKAERIDSKHPTVKPIALMRYLCRLVTPPGGTVLDPFAGTGTTGAAALAEGFDAILIEREAEYQADICRRLSLPLPWDIFA